MVSVYTPEIGRGGCKERGDVPRVRMRRGDPGGATLSDESFGVVARHKVVAQNCRALSRGKNPTWAGGASLRCALRLTWEVTPRPVSRDAIAERGSAPMGSIAIDATSG